MWPVRFNVCNPRMLLSPKTYDWFFFFELELGQVIGLATLYRSVRSRVDTPDSLPTMHRDDFRLGAGCRDILPKTNLGFWGCKTDLP